jgi:hypothetical protein
MFGIRSLIGRREPVSAGDPCARLPKESGGMAVVVHPLEDVVQFTCYLALGSRDFRVSRCPLLALD